MVEHLGKLRFWLLAVALSVSAVAVTAACNTKEVVRTVEVPVERVVEKEVVKEVEVPGETVVVEREVVKEVEVPGETVVVPITEIVFWYWADTPAQGVFFRKTIDEFNKTHPSIKVVGEVQPAALPAREKMATGALAGLGPDVTLIGLSFAQEFYRAGIIRGLDEFFDKWPGNVDIPEKLVEVDRAKTEDAPLIMLPVAYRVDFQFYRKDIYEAAGLKPAETVDEMFDTARALTVPPNQYGYGLRGADGWGFIYDVLNVLVAEGITLTDGKGGSDLDSPVAIETFEKIAKIYKDGITQPSAIQDRFPQMVAAFQTGKIAQWAASTVHWGMLRGEEGEFEHLIGVAPHAKGRAGQVAPVTPVGWAMASVTRHPEEAWEFMAYLTSPDVVDEFSRILAYAPALKSVSERPYFQENPALKLSSDLAPYHYLYPYDHKNWNLMVQDTAPTLWQQVLLEELTAEAMAKQLADLMRDVD